MTHKLKWLSWLIVVGGVLAGCSYSQTLGEQEATTVAESTYVHQVSVKETTVSRLDNGWSIGLDAVSRGDYVDADGHAQTGRVARISIATDGQEQAESIRVYEGMIFSMGEQRFQVIKLKPNTSLSQAPGSSNGYIVIGQLP